MLVFPYFTQLFLVRKAERLTCQNGLVTV